MKQSRPRILLIDDNKHGMLARRHVLEESGFAVETATNGVEGLAIFESSEFDAVVTDYRMPGGLGGRQVLESIRCGERPRTPVVILSGYVTKLGLADELLQADAVLPKGPAELEQLTRALARLTKRPAASEKAQSSSKRRTA